ncbi:hypothetical protein PQR65_05305 [Paraburkholderia nemoris]|uniref:hypothetical protein n=1 Tax=Paraburkholderia nemoris TaxID=2793076 RepID=UPI0038BD0DF9
MDALYDEAIENMERTVHALEARVPRPKRVPIGEGPEFSYRYTEKTLHQALVQKMARIVSALRAARLLLSNGFVQEQAAMHRMLDETEEDVSFLAYGAISGDVTDLHKKYLEYFYQEEFGDPLRPVETLMARATVPRRKIHAYLSRIEGAPFAPGRAVDLNQTLSKTYSGYVHGASPHIMDMYGGNTPRFHMNGMRHSPLWAVHSNDFWNYVFRGICCFTFAAKAFRDEMLFNELCAYLKHFEQMSGRQ